MGVSAYLGDADGSPFSLGVFEFQIWRLQFLQKLVSSHSLLPYLP